MSDDNVVELKQPDVCDFCKEETPVCEMDMHIRYRALPTERFRVVIQACTECAKELGVDADTAMELANTPQPEQPVLIAAPSIPQEDRVCVVCGDPAVILTRDGPMCAGHAFGQ